jgi:hypothetical protein
MPLAKIKTKTTATHLKDGSPFLMMTPTVFVIRQAWVMARGCWVQMWMRLKRYWNGRQDRRFVGYVFLLNAASGVA